MTRREWSAQFPRLAWLGLIGLAVVLAVVAAMGMTESSTIGPRVEAVVENLRPMPTAEDASRPDNAGERRTGPSSKNGSADSDDPAAAAVSRVRQRFLFMPAPPQQFRNVQGVLGDRVLYAGGQSYGLGENAMGAIVVALGTNWVELQHEGETITLDIFNGAQRGPEVKRWDGTPPTTNQNASGGNMNQRGNRQWGGESSGRRSDRNRGERRNREGRSDRSRRGPPDQSRTENAGDAPEMQDEP